MIDKCYIGPAGWSYKDWEGVVYPAPKPKGFHQLEYISSFFNSVEINSSFYRPPTDKTTIDWIHRVTHNRHFLFTYKLWQNYTHLRDPFPSAADEKSVKSGLDPLADNNKLGALLMQFPWSFKNTSENVAYIDKLLRLFAHYHPVIELRHGSWNDDNFFDYLKNKNCGFANIDQPVIGDSINLAAIVTSPIGYLRYHGRNYQHWFKDGQPAAARYDYLYSENELADFQTIIGSLIENSAKTFIIFNNHYRGQAIANALQTMFLIDKEKIAVPATMFAHFAELAKIAKSESLPDQMNLF